jgi:hypothetical protein
VSVRHECGDHVGFSCHLCAWCRRDIEIGSLKVLMVTFIFSNILSKMRLKILSRLIRDREQKRMSAP